MPHLYPRRRRRLTAASLAAGLVCAALALGGQPAQAAPGKARVPHSLGAQQSAEPKADPHGKLGAHARALLQQARSRKARTVTVMLATDPGHTAEVRKRIAALGGTTATSDDRLGYLRATVPTGAAEQLAGLSAVTAMDLNETYKLPDPSPVGAADSSAGTSGSSSLPAAPGASTPAVNPYLPVGETGAAAFVAQHPEWDGRGTTVGILDTGVDLDHPALRTTTTGERKITAWETATDPVTGADPTWLMMTTKVDVTGTTFTSAGITWTAPATGAYEFRTFSEHSLAASEYGGDVNRDGDTTDVFGVLYRPADHTVWVDADQDRVFDAGDVVRPYDESGQVAHFGTDDPATAVVESVPFTVEARPGVDLSALGGSYIGRTADFVDIGLAAESHATHVAGIIAGHGLLGGSMNGAAPGARIVSERVCTASGCSSYALTEGMIDAVVNRHVDVVNLSVGGLDALNDGSDVRELLYNRLIDGYGVQIFVSAGNDGPGMNTVASPSVATEAVSVGASVSKATWWADYGSEVDAGQALFPFSARGPREDGEMKPTLVAPGAAVSSIPMWQAGAAVPQTGYQLPPGYAMENGTSMAAPEATGAAALLLSAARAQHRSVTPAALRNAMTSSARFLDDVPAYAQGAGLVSVGEAWKLLARGAEPTGLSVRAPVCTVLSGALATPDTGGGVYNRCAADHGGQSAGQVRTYDLKLTRTTPGSGPLTLSWQGDDGTFSSPPVAQVEQGRTVTVPVRALPRATGAHSAVLRIDDPSTPGIDKLVLVTVIAAAAPSAPQDSVSQDGSVARNGTRSLFVDVPEGAQALRVDLGGLADGSQTRFLAIDPQGLPVESNAVSQCYADFSDEKACPSGSRSYTHPMAGVWEIEVESRRTTPQRDNPYTLTAAVQGVTLDPATGTVDQAAVHEPVERTFTATDSFGPVNVRPVGGALGAMEQVRGNVADQQQTNGRITVPRDAQRLEVTLGDPADTAADLDLYLVNSVGQLVASSARGGSAESVSVDRPAPGFYYAIVAGTRVPSGSTAFTVQDTVFSDSLGSVTVDAPTSTSLAHGDSLTFRGRLVADERPPTGRQLVARFGVASEQGVLLGSTDLVVGRVTQPQANVLAGYGPATGFSLTDDGRIGGSQQINSHAMPVRWDQQHGVVPLAAGGASSGYVLGQSSTAGYAVGQLSIPTTGTRGGLWNAQGDLTVLPLPQWQSYSYDRAFAVNDSGLVVGNASGTVTDPATGRKSSVNHGFAWTAATGFTRLADLSSDGSQTEPLAVDDAGTIVGDSRLGGHREAALWHADGSVTDLGTLPGMADSYAQAVSPSGTVVGTSGDDAFVLRPGGTMTRLPDFGFDAHALAVNDAGWILGTAETQPDEDTAVVWDPQGRMFDLGAMVDQSHWQVQEGIGLNSAGEVAFYAADKTDGGTTRIVLAQL